MRRANRPWHQNRLAEEVRRLRAEKGWSQYQLAEVMQVDRKDVVRLESGQKPVTLDLVERVAGVFELGPIELLLAIYGRQSYTIMSAGDSSHTQEEFEREIQDYVMADFRASIGREELVELVEEAVQIPTDKIRLLTLLAQAFKNQRDVLASGEFLIRGPGGYMTSERKLLESREKLLSTLWKNIRN